MSRVISATVVTDDPGDAEVAARLLTDSAALLSARGIPCSYSYSDIDDDQQEDQT